MRLHTSAEGMTLAKKLEAESAKFYEDMAQRYSKYADTFLAFVKENKRTSSDLERTYNWVITDAIEGCYCLDLDPDEFTINTDLSGNASLPEALKKAMEMEDRIIKYYTTAAEQAKPLMADVPRAFSIVARKRNARLAQLKSLVEKEAA